MEKTLAPNPKEIYKQRQETTANKLKPAKLPHGLSVEAIEKLIKDKPLRPEVTEQEFIDMSVKKNRDRMVLPKRLPVLDLLPFPIDEHPWIGEFESKQNLYLTLAHAYNSLIERIELLEAEIKNLKNK